MGCMRCSEWCVGCPVSVGYTVCVACAVCGVYCVLCGVYCVCGVLVRDEVCFHISKSPIPLVSFVLFILILSICPSFFLSFLPSFLPSFLSTFLPVYCLPLSYLHSSFTLLSTYTLPSSLLSHSITLFLTISHCLPLFLPTPSHSLPLPSPYYSLSLLSLPSPTPSLLLPLSIYLQAILSLVNPSSIPWWLAVFLYCSQERA